MTPDEYERLVLTARRAPDQRLADEWARGPEAFRPGAWEILDREIRRRRIRVLPENDRPESKEEPLSDLEPADDRSTRSRLGLRVLLRLSAIALVIGLLCVVVGIIPPGSLTALASRIEQLPALQNRGHILIEGALLALLGVIGLVATAIYG